MQATGTEKSTDWQHHHDHYQPLIDAIPPWLGKASASRRLALKNTLPQLLDPLKTAPATDHSKLKALNAAHWTAQNDVDQRLAHLQDASAFAETLLKDALKTRFDLDLDVRKTFLRLYVPAETPWFPIKTGDRAWTVSLLDAALHNFERHETEDAAYEAESTFITAPSPTGQFDTLPLIKDKLSIPAFTRLCRELDIGARYKTYLEDNLGISNAVAAAVLRTKVDQSQKAALQAALQLARMKGDISEDYFRLIGGLADGVQGIRLDGQALFCQDLSLISARLTGIVVFAPDLDQAPAGARVVAYVPDDPEHPIKEYTSSQEMRGELIRQLRSQDYQRFFSRFVNHEQRGIFFTDLNKRLSHVTWYQPEPGSSLPAWRETPIDNPNLQFAIAPISADLWQHLYQGKLNKILNDARVIAVSTATADQKARWALWDSMVKIAATILEIAAFVAAPFVPVLGEMMMAYMAYQLLDETFEGIVEWAQGRTSEAFEHLMDAMEALLQLAAFDIGSTIAIEQFLPLLPKEALAFIDRFKPVKLADGQTRYWDQDLANYRQQTTLPADSRANALGLHQHQGRQILPIDQSHYAVSESTQAGQYQIEHPSRPEAYKPLLRHNGDGAWHTELEQPLAWDTATLLQRIGHNVESFSAAQREQILKVSGFTEDALRKMHVNQELLPPLLADTIKRFKIDQDLQLFIDQLDSELPDQYLKADAATQLQLLADQGSWPKSKRLRLVNEQGDIAWQSSTDENLPLTEIRQGRLMDEDPLKTLLQSLDETAAKVLLGEEAAGPMLALDVRARMLRKQLVNIARRQRSTLFEARYKALEQPEDPLAQKIAKQQPQLPASVIRELLDTASGAELEEISQGLLPDRQRELVDQAKQEVRISRAYEGLYLDSVSNPDTDTLALHSLQRLQGWTKNVNIEVRDRSYQGQVLDSTGHLAASEQKVLVRRTDGSNQPYDDQGQELHSATDFYSSVLYALPDSERQALDIHIGQRDKLKTALRERALERNNLRLTISLPPAPEPVTDTLRLLGLEGYSRINTYNEPTFSLEDRVREIYPALSPRQIEAYLSALQSHATGARDELSRLGSEYRRLINDVHRWANDIPSTMTDTGLPLTAIERRTALQNRRFLRDTLQRCWRRETYGPYGYRLVVPGPILGDLPTLNADFSHVSILAITGSGATQAILPFLENFPGLRYLELRNFDLGSLPPTFAAMPGLQQLLLIDCGIVLTPEGQARLSSLSHLTDLDLDGNPLGRTPDLRALPGLRYVRLSNTGISALPDGLLTLAQLHTAILRGNQISELPEAFFNLAPEVRGGFDLSSNPLNAISRERIKSRYHRTGQSFRVLAEQGDLDQVIALFPGLDPVQASHLFYRLPGTLDEGRAQLSQWHAEFTRLSSDLESWAQAVPDYHPTSGQPLNAQEMYADYVARMEFAQNLKGYWSQREPDNSAIRTSSYTLTLTFMGDMPTLAADFSHVSLLSLQGNVRVGATETFLARFTGLDSLTMHNFALGDVPRSISQMPELQTLILSDCGVVLTPQSQTILASLRHLDSLDLYQNPLGLPPDLPAMPRLIYIDLANTGITEVPAGLIEHPRISTAIFNGNRISELPAALFDLPGSRVEGLDFANNPLSATTLERIKTYYQQYQQDLGVLAPQADLESTKTLHPSLDNEEASDFVYRLPGTLEEGRIELTRRKAELIRRQPELTALLNELTVWTTDIPDHPVTGRPLEAGQLLQEQHKRKDFMESLERCWRQTPTQSATVSETGFESTLPIMGDLPVLTTEFAHVTELYLTSAGGITPRASRFLEYFPNLESLTVRSYQLNDIPEVVFRMPKLTVLSLTECRITLTPRTLNALAGMENLDLLNLRDNPLGLAPDLSNMRAITTLDLSHTGISEIPRGFFDIESWTEVDLRFNQITEMPATLLDINPDVSDSFNFNGNPFSAQSLQRIATYYNQTNNDLGIEEIANLPLVGHQPTNEEIED